MEQKTTHNIVDTLNEIDDAVTQTNRQLWALLAAAAVIASVLGLFVLSRFFNLEPFFSAFFSGLCTLLAILAGVGLIALLIIGTIKYSEKLDETTKQYYIQYIQERHDFRHDTHAKLVTAGQYLVKVLLLVSDISAILGGYIMLFVLGNYAASTHDVVSAYILAGTALASIIGGISAGVILFIWQSVLIFDWSDNSRIALGFNAKLYDYKEVLKRGVEAPKSALLNRIVLFKLPPKEQWYATLDQHI